MTKSAATTADRCAACGAAFHCGAGDAAPCPCGSITLSPAQLAGLRQQFNGCLCLDCLRAHQQAHQHAHQAADTANHECKEPSRSA